MPVSFPDLAASLKSTGNNGKLQLTNTTGLPAIGNTSNNSAGPFNNTPGRPGVVVQKQGPHWLNSSTGSLKNLTKKDPLYASWTGHLVTPLEVTLNNTSSYPADNGTGIVNPPARIYGTLNQGQLDNARETAHIRINAMIQRMGVLQSYILNSSSLTVEQKAVLLGEAESNTLWLSGKDAEIQLTTDVDAIQLILADTETRMSAMEIDLQQNMGILACNEMNSRISEALNVSITINDRIGRLDLADVDRALVRQDVEDCREHLLNASMYSDSAAESFQSIDSRDNADINYSHGLDQLQQSKTELDMAYLTINKIFHRTVDNTKL